MNKSSLWYLRPDEYLNRFLEQGVRCDGRKPEVCRNFKLELNKLSSNHYGAISVRIGNSSYIACCNPQIIHTGFDQESNNVITNSRINVSLELPTICGFTGNSNHSNFVSNTITECLNDTRIINKKAFITKFQDKEIHWVIDINVVCLSYDGNPFDYTLIAAIASLCNTSLPENLIWDDTYNWFRFSSESISKNEVRKEHKMQDTSEFFLKKVPIFVSFSYLNDSIWVCDPNYMEDSIGSTVTICCVDDQINTLQTQCISKYTPGRLKNDLSQLIAVASKRADEIRACLLGK
ncbi:ribosomal RNA processing protein 43 [Cryptosporidium ubiquitum]|uniref:Ribosomal RNA-processing protein 43 n=1 Tax=Cryptosporidium ubiquitum TaxID=857276 RepID=A0A1J4MIQ2_9CRYT|nr:ribosomal RNA processing protein 43 [Cryptosporidium ubiquitum]OII73895.1 ribosomal RNA processing protein 43 [Cryptosporidium ubiquitum]